MIVYAYEYETDAASKAQYKAFVKWSRSKQETNESASAWRTLDPESGTWFVIVADETDDKHTLRFEWRGKPYKLAREQAKAFVLRRAERAVAAYAEGRRGRYTEQMHYGPNVAPRLTGDGLWVFPKGGEG